MFFLYHIFNILMFFLSIVGAGFLVSQNNDAKSFMEKHLTKYLSLGSYSGVYITEPRVAYNAGNASGRIIKSKRIYIPHLYLEIKFIENNGNVLNEVQVWDMSNAEIVLAPSSWRRTNGIEEMFVNNNKCNSIYKLLALISHNKYSVEQVIGILGSDFSDLMNTIDILKNCGLIQEVNKILKLTIKNPVLPEVPFTEQSNIFETVTLEKPEQDKLITPTYSMKEIIELAQSIFGNTLKIKKSRLIYVPAIYVVEETSAGAITTKVVNLLTGAEIKKIN